MPPREIASLLIQSTARLCDLIDDVGSLHLHILECEISTPLDKYPTGSIQTSFTNLTF